MPSFAQPFAAAPAGADRHTVQVEVLILARVTLGLALSACWSASSLPAQTDAEVKESRNWALQGLRAGYCIRFLVDPKRAADELREGFVLLPAERDQSLDPALRQIVQSQPEFAGWIPSQVCFYFSDAVQVGKRRLAERGRRYQMLGVWTMAALEQGSGGRRDLALGLYANRESLLRAARVAEVRIKEVHSVVDRADTSSIFSVKIGKTLLAWNGRQAGDSTRVTENIEESWSVPGLRSKLWSARLTIKPTFRWSLVGSLRVEGKGDLGEALRGSPIRFMGPLYQGGGGELRFSQ